MYLPSACTQSIIPPSPLATTNLFCMSLCFTGMTIPAIFWLPPQICRWHHPYGRGEEELKSLLMELKEERGKAGLKLNIQKTKIMASGPITSWQIVGETVETVRNFIFLCSKITADGDCSHEIKRRLLLGRKAIINLDSILKSRDVTLLTKVHLVKAVVFPVVMYGCDSWTIRKAEHQRIDAFELWCWKRLLRVTWIVRRSNQEIKAGGEGHERGWDGWMASPT